MPWLKKSQTVETPEQREARAAQQPVPTNKFVAELQAAAMANSKVYKDEAPEGYTTAKEATPISELNMKDKSKDKSKSKGDRGKSWAIKEKKKRDLGMQARGKSNVEEEKRILRASAAGGYGFD